MQIKDTSHGLPLVESVQEAPSAEETMSEIQASSSLDREDFGDVTVLRINVPMLRADEVTDDLFQRITSLAEDGGRCRLVLNCEQVVFLSSMALGRLATLSRKVRAAGGRLTLCKVARTVEEILIQTHLADILLIYQDEQEAVRSFG